MDDVQPGSQRSATAPVQRAGDPLSAHREVPAPGASGTRCEPRQGNAPAPSEPKCATESRGSLAVCHGGDCNSAGGTGGSWSTVHIPVVVFACLLGLLASCQFYHRRSGTRHPVRRQTASLSPERIKAAQATLWRRSSLGIELLDRRLDGVRRLAPGAEEPTRKRARREPKTSGQAPWQQSRVVAPEPAKRRRSTRIADNLEKGILGSYHGAELLYHHHDSAKLSVATPYAKSSAPGARLLRGPVLPIDESTERRRARPTIVARAVAAASDIGGSLLICSFCEQNTFTAKTSGGLLHHISCKHQGQIMTAKQAQHLSHLGKVCCVDCGGLRDERVHWCYWCQRATRPRGIRAGDRVQDRAEHRAKGACCYAPNGAEQPLSPCKRPSSGRPMAETVPAAPLALGCPGEAKPQNFAVYKDPELDLARARLSRPAPVLPISEEEELEAATDRATIAQVGSRILST